MLRIVFVLLFSCSSVPTLLAQAAGVQAAPSCSFKELFNSGGWDIPGLSGAELKGHGRYAGEGVPENVFVEILEPQNPEASLTLISRGPGDRIEVKNMPVDVTQIERYTMNGHVFGYHVIAVDAAYENGKRVHFGYQERVYFYDPDGSGKFSIRREAGELLFKIVIPDWAKRANSSQARPPKR